MKRRRAAFYGVAHTSTLPFTRQLFIIVWWLAFDHAGCGARRSGHVLGEQRQAYKFADTTYERTHTAHLVILWICAHDHEATCCVRRQLGEYGSFAAAV